MIATGGSVTVESVSDGSAVLRLGGIPFSFPEGTTSDTLLSGTLSGRIIQAVDMG